MKAQRIWRGLAICALAPIPCSTYASQFGIETTYDPVAPEAWSSQIVLDHGDADECQSSHMSAYNKWAAGDVPFFDSNSHHPLKPHFTSLNASTGEQWEFDAVSADGDAGILIAFYRDPEFSFLGPGDLRINLDLTFSNGTMASLVDYAEQSVIEFCPTHTTGTWFRKGASYKFRIAHDMSTASVSFDAPDIRGTMELHSTAKPRCADGSSWPPPTNSSGSYDMVRGMYWMEPMPAAQTSVDLDIRGSPFSFGNGIGGAERIWQSRTWFEMLHEYEFLRAAVGPYTMSYWASTAAEGRVGNLLLSRDGERVFSSSLRTDSPGRRSSRETSGLVDDHFMLRPTFGGDLRSSVGGRTETGYDLIISSPSRNKQWSFHFEHKQTLFEFNLGRGAGGSSFMGPATGGEKGAEEKFQGTFVNESVNFANLWVPSFVRFVMWTYHYARRGVSEGIRSVVEMVVAYQM
ncbi:hypothetical protein F4861DRAFT_524183 [Xylaria intraflava]|nr:hypothetical protein F4861DRAFT_524183 [Xylaria intraflava]